jgi:hypothetical protein
MLKNAVPFSRGTQDSKAMILKKAVEYIMALEQELSIYHQQQQHQQPPPTSSSLALGHPPQIIAPQPFLRQPQPQQSHQINEDYYHYNLHPSQLPLPPPPPQSAPPQLHRYDLNQSTRLYQTPSLPTHPSPPLPLSALNRPPQSYSYLSSISRPTSTPPLNNYSFYQPSNKRNSVPDITNNNNTNTNRYNTIPPVYDQPPASGMYSQIPPPIRPASAFTPLAKPL